MTSVAECLNRYRKARRTANAIIAAHSAVGWAADDLMAAASRMNDRGWEIAAQGPISEATRALVLELLREHEASIAGVTT